MLQAVCEHIHNDFGVTRISGTFKIENGTLEIPEIINNQRFRIIGSALNDGIYTWMDDSVYDDDGIKAAQLLPEEFTGTIILMGVPRAVIDLCAEISTWRTKYEEMANSPLQSESFGGYSYSKGGNGSGNGSKGPLTWEGVFASRLNPWRKLA